MTLPVFSQPPACREDAHFVSTRAAREPQVEEAEEALVDGDVAIDPGDLTHGTARAAMRSRDFRVVWTGTMASNVGTWMQNVALGAFAYTLTKSQSFVALIGFAQLGPLLLLAPLGGVLADRMDRRFLLILTNL